MKKLSLAMLAACLPFTACWAGGAADQITVIDPYVTMAPPNATATAAYMVLKNDGSAEIKLTKVDDNAAKATELHAHIHEGGMMKMRQVPDIALAAKSETALQPGGLHIMLIGLTAPLKEGDKIAFTLSFSDGSSKQIEATVRKLMAAMDHGRM
jgi:copper(I)-binding protein